MALLKGKLIATSAFINPVFLFVSFGKVNTRLHRKTIAKQLFMWSTSFNDILKLIFPLNDKIQCKSLETAHESGLTCVVKNRKTLITDPVSGWVLDFIFSTVKFRFI